MEQLGLRDLVANRTLSSEMAATMAVAAEESRSMLFVAIPRLAGKSTLMRAALRHVPDSTPVFELSSALGPDLGIPGGDGGGYLVASELSPAGLPDYLWGADVRRLFAAPRAFAIATALHAGGVGEAFEVITRENRVPDEQAARLDLVVYIRSIGPWRRPVRRVVEAVYEIDGVTGGRPRARLLHRWSEDDDQFEVVERPGRIGAAA